MGTLVFRTSEGIMRAGTVQESLTLNHKIKEYTLSHFPPQIGTSGDLLQLSIVK